MPDNVVSIQQATRSARPPHLREAPQAQPFKYRWLDLVSLDPELTLLQIRILMRLNRYADLDGQNIFPRHQVLADELGVHLKTVRRNLRELEALQWITCTKKGTPRGNNRSEYILRVPRRLLLPV
jgi:hypothetical protein